MERPTTAASTAMPSSRVQWGGRKLTTAARRRAPVAISILAWGAIITGVQVHTLFLLPEGTYFGNHSGTTCQLRILEFRDCLAAGYWSPQWCTDFRQGFGSPYFGYYPPGFFYAASLVPASLGLVRATAIAVAAFSFVGCSFMYLLVSGRFGRPAGIVAGSVLALAEYGETNLYIRGDVSEFSAMMLIPALLFYLDGWLEAPTRFSFAGLAASAGLIVIMHCCIALACFAFVALYLCVRAMRPQLRRAALLGLVAMFLGSGLAAFYWFPVLLEWNLVSPDKAFTGIYDFAGHFVEPLDLAVFHNPDDVPMYLGFMTLGLMACNITAVLWQWPRMNVSQRKLFSLAAWLCGFAVVLMNASSAPLWSNLPLLYRLQFPWRLLALLSPGVAIIAGCVLPWRDGRMQWAVVCLFVINLAVLSVLNPKRQVALIPFVELRSAAEIANVHFAPDDADEWLPVGARLDRNAIVPRFVRTGPVATARNYHQVQGRLECEVRATQSSYVDLPHLFFPGWTARLGGQELSIGPNADAMMRISLPANCAGLLQAEFSMTPMRFWGLVTSAVCALILVVIGLAPIGNTATCEIAGSHCFHPHSTLNLPSDVA